MVTDPAGCRALAAYLSGVEAKQLADRLSVGDSLTMALTVVGSMRRRHVGALMREADLSIISRETMVAVLRSIEGAHSKATSISPVWTAPANMATSGALTASIAHFVASARESVTCSTYNFQRSSVLWKSLAAAAARPSVAVRVYVDTAAADERPQSWSPTTQQVADELPGAVVLRTKHYGGKLVRSHAKFIAVDHRYLIVTSANFSKSAELMNIELGLQIEDSAVTQSVERQMRALEPHAYEAIRRESSD